MTAETAPGQAGATMAGPAESGPARQPGPSQLTERMVRYGIWLAAVKHTLGDRQFQARVISSALGAYALAYVIKDNQARPVRRAADWYRKLGNARNPQELHRARRR